MRRLRGNADVLDERRDDGLVPELGDAGSCGGGGHRGDPAMLPQTTKMGSEPDFLGWALTPIFAGWALTPIFAGWALTPIFTSPSCLRCARAGPCAGRACPRARPCGRGAGPSR